MSLNEALSWIAMPLSHSIDRPRPCSAAGNPTKNVDIVSIESRVSPVLIEFYAPLCTRGYTHEPTRTAMSRTTA